MNFKPFNIMVALVFRGDERPVISQSVFFTEKLNAQLTIIHVNQPALSQPKGKIAKHIDEDAIREKITAYGFEKILNKIDIIIENGESVSEIIKKYAQNMDLIRATQQHMQLLLIRQHILKLISLTNFFLHL